MKRYQILNILSTVLTLTVNGLANALPLNGQTTAEISDRFPALFVPAGYVFSIWGLIYLGLLAFTIYQAQAEQRDNNTLEAISPLYWLASAANIVWIFLWHYEIFALTIVVMLVLLGALIGIYRTLRTTDGTSQDAFAWTVRWPFSVYLGWISVATIANTSQLLYFSGWTGWGLGTELWTGIMLITAAGAGFFMLFRERDRAFALVLVWALVGIAVKQASASSLVSNSAWGLAAALALGIAARGLSQYRKQVRQP